MKVLTSQDLMVYTTWQHNEMSGKLEFTLENNF